ncbi:MAG TPA: hypothetical protein P5084_03435 [Paludibacter sp.]|nr:hypothetical protein [Paludibacter sp.]
MKKILLAILVFTSSSLFGQINKDLCEKLFYSYQSAGTEFSYAKGDLKSNIRLVEQKYQESEYLLKNSFLENTSFTKGSISINYARNSETNKMVKETILNISTDYTGEFTGNMPGLFLINQFLRFEDNLKNCFTGANITFANLTEIEGYTHAFKYVLYTKNVFKSDVLIDESLTIDNPYIEINLHKTLGKIMFYTGIKIIHRTIVE